jgi:Fe-S-cluster containining protein
LAASFYFLASTLMHDLSEPYFNHYLQLVKEVDAAFAQVSRQYSELVMCKPGCNHCCFAVFEMQPVEAAYLSRKFHFLLSRKERREILKKANKAITRLADIENTLKASSTLADPTAYFLALSRERVECPLLVQAGCALYPHRPITCRIYGIPASIRGKGVTCGWSGFLPGEHYPTVNMDLIDKRLYEISRVIVAEAAGLDLSQGALLFSVAKALQQPLSQQYFLKLKSHWATNRP